MLILTKTTLPTLLLWLVVLMTGLACAESDPVRAEDAGILADEGVELDTHEPDEVGLDTGPDIVVEPDTRCGVCCPEDVQCANSTTRAFCSADGTQFEEEACADGELCEAGACVLEPVCEIGEQHCHDSENLRVCRASRTGFANQACPEGTSCIGAACVSGAPNGAPCSTGDDCAGGRCQCGDDESCPPGSTPAYCTGACDAQSCDSSEWCFSADDLNVAHLDDHCVRRCDQTCAIEGLSCKPLPVKTSEGASWQSGCFHDTMVGIGEECTSDAQCIGGICLQGYFNTGYCTRRCETGGCPDNAACIELDGNWMCTLKCNDNVCPLDQPVNRLDVRCQLRSQHDGGGAANVCVRS